MSGRVCLSARFTEKQSEGERLQFVVRKTHFARLTKSPPTKTSFCPSPGGAAPRRLHFDR